MDQAKVPPATLRALKALDAQPNKRLSFADFRKEAGVKGRAYYPFCQRLRDQSLIAYYGDLSGHKGYELTFAAMGVLSKQEAR